MPEQTSNWLISKETFGTFDLEIMEAHWLFFSYLKKVHIILEDFFFLFNLSEEIFVKIEVRQYHPYLRNFLITENRKQIL